MEQRNEQTFRNYVCNTAHNLLGYRLRKIGRVSTDKKLVLCNIRIGHYSTVQQEKAFSVEPDQPSQIPTKPAQAGFIFVLFAKSASGELIQDVVCANFAHMVSDGRETSSVCHPHGGFLFALSVSLTNFT